VTIPVASNPARPTSVARTILADRHFLVAAAILALTAGAWGPAMHWLDIHTLKERVPWPAPVRVSEDGRWTSLPDRLGPFRKIEPNDGLLGADGKPVDGENVFPRHDLDTLGMESDPSNREKRCSNWYVSRLYVDPRPQAPVRLWGIGVFYYTGGRDTVPHVPEICMGAAGLKNVVSDRLVVNLPGLPEGWAKAVPFSRTRATDKDGRPRVEYYTFSMNGEFGVDRLWVRRRLINPFVRHAYFAKIQFSPLGGSADFDEMDLSAEEFLRSALPEVLKALPSSRDVKALERSTP